MRSSRISTKPIRIRRCSRNENAELFSLMIPLLLLYQAIVQQWSVSIPMALIMVVAGFLFVSVSAYLAGLVGSSNNPVSGITICTILFASVILMLLLRALGFEPNPYVIYPLYLYALVLLIVGVTVLVNRRLEDSHIGRAWEAIREDQTAAQAMGVPLVRMKLLARGCDDDRSDVDDVVRRAAHTLSDTEEKLLADALHADIDEITTEVDLVLAEHDPGGRHLDEQDANRVGDDVVQFARETAPLVFAHLMQV